MNLSTLKSYIKMGREIEFSYDGVMYSITYSFEGNTQTISFCQFNQSCIDYSSIDSFLSSASIGEELLKNIIDDIEDVVIY